MRQEILWRKFFGALVGLMESLKSKVFYALKYFEAQKQFCVHSFKNNLLKGFVKFCLKAY